MLFPFLDLLSDGKIKRLYQHFLVVASTTCESLNRMI